MRDSILTQLSMATTPVVRIVTDQTKAEMRKARNSIWSICIGNCFENQSGKAGFTAMRRQEAEHPVEDVGRDLRVMFSWKRLGVGRPCSNQRSPSHPAYFILGKICRSTSKSRSTLSWRLLKPMRPTR